MRQISRRSAAGVRGWRAAPARRCPPAAACRCASSAAARVLASSDRQRSQAHVSSRWCCNETKGMGVPGIGRMARLQPAAQ